MSDDELPPSKLGTKNHWDEVYEREVRVYEDVGDEGEVWFGESAVNKMRQWATKHLPSSPAIPVRVLECGSGNGTLLLSFLTSPASSSTQPDKYSLTGIDYSPLAASLASSIEATRRTTLEEELDEDEEIINECTVEWRTEDLLRKDFGGETWDLVLDKGTFDALALCDEGVEEEGGRLPSQVYPERVSKLVQEGGFFLITSCNFTEEEIKRRYTKEGLGFVYHSNVPHKSFAFGGKTGTTVCTVAFKKVAVSSSKSSNPIVDLPIPISASSSSASSSEALYICIDCGGTKTEVAIASGEGKIVARGAGGTSNMAEVGLETSYRIITETVLSAIDNLPPALRGHQPSDGSGGIDQSPIAFEDVWVGISGCDTELDERMMSDKLGSFFSYPSLPILNDAHLLGGVLLTNGCQWGIAVISGTGSVVLQLKVVEGKVVQTGRRGGFGFLLGDDGSAYDLGRWALRLAVDDYDSGSEQEGGLAEKIRQQFGVEKTGEVLAKVYSLDADLSASEATNQRKLRVSSLAYPIIECYSLTPPDPLAKRVVEASVTLLAESIENLVKQTLSSPSSSSSSDNASSSGPVGQAQNGLGNTKRLEDAALIIGGGVGRQDCYRDTLRRVLADKGMVFGREECIVDVAGDGCLGLVARAKSRS